MAPERGPSDMHGKAWPFGHPPYLRVIQTKGQLLMQTPDPWLTSEQFAALAATIITNVVVLLKLDVSDAQQGALLALVNAAYVIAILVHASVVRNGRARALGVPYPERLADRKPNV
jgi:predicted lysophospholipase L1 biosynthesis ABC-type transport system permease subunit